MSLCLVHPQASAVAHTLCFACWVGQEGAREAKPWQDFLHGALFFVLCPGFLCHGREWRMRQATGMLCVQLCFPQLCCL